MARAGAGEGGSGRVVHIEGRAVGGGHPPYVVAELSANHLGDRERALRILEAAAQSGADAVKLQTYTPEAMTLDSAAAGFTLEGGPWRGRTLYDLYREAQTPWEWHAPLFERGRELGVTVFSSPFDAAAVERLEGLGAPAYKIASFELIDHELVACAAATGRPLILSTGMADLDEVAESVDVARAAGAHEMVLLHCVSGYPTPVEESNLRRMTALAERFDAVVGLSDHSLGDAVPVAATALGAALIEKHVTLSRTDGGPDAGFSLEPDELARLVRDCRAAHAALGDGSSAGGASQCANRRFRRSLYVARDLDAGESLSRADLRCLRPGLGLAPKHLGEVLGRVVRRPLRRGEPLTWEVLAPLDGPAAAGRSRG